MTEAVLEKEFELVVGLEVHCQLATASKLFCACPSGSFGLPANTHVCPVCTGQPGTLPVLNAAAVELGFKAALGLGCRLNETSIFARKNYFYPDLPKGYQISQYEQPFSEHGALEIQGPPPKRIGIHRIHLEEDAGKLLHSIGAEELGYSLVDFNRAGVPLIEIVSAPDIRSPEEAAQYLVGLKAVLQYLGVSNCDMEKGEMRCDANVSVRPRGQAVFGTRAEIKNLNSFRGVRDAIAYEFARQCELVREGGRVAQETRLWDADSGLTRPMRSKEEAHDYRYFPDPDLVPLRAEPALVRRLKETLPELPAERRKRFVQEYQLSEYDAGVLTSDKLLADYFVGVVAASGSNRYAKASANWIQGELLAKLNATGTPFAKAQQCIPPAHLGEMVRLIGEGTLSSKLAKDVFAKMWETGQAPQKLVSSLGLSQVTDEGQIAAWVLEAMGENQKAVEDLRNGKERAIGAIVGSVMKKSKGKANPDLVNRLIKEKLNDGKR